MSHDRYQAIAARVQTVLYAHGDSAYALSKRLDVKVNHVYEALSGNPRRPGLLLRMAHELAIPTEEAA